MKLKFQLFMENLHLMRTVNSCYEVLMKFILFDLHSVQSLPLDDDEETRHMLAYLFVVLAFLFLDKKRLIKINFIL